MIRRVIENDDGVIPPINSVLVELIHQLSEKDIHNLGIRIRLDEAQVHISESIESNDHRNSRLHLHNWL